MRLKKLWSLLTKPPGESMDQDKENLPLDSPPSFTPARLKLDDELLRFSSHKLDRWTLRDAARGLVAFGGIGAGKSSGSGKKIATQFLKSGMGGLVLCVKTDEALEWEDLIARTERKKDLIRIRAGSSMGFNFLDWEQKRSSEQGGGLVTNITNFFMDVISVIDRNQSSKAEDGFWDRTLRELLSNAIVIASCLSESLTLSNLLRLIEAAPQTVRNRVEEQNQKTEFFHSSGLAPDSFELICTQARKNCPDQKRRELESSIQFFNERFSALAEKTRSIVVASFTSMADPLLREPLLSLFCQGTQVKPEDCFSGKIVVIDVPVHSFQLVGRIANLIWKTAFKRACQQRVRPETPVFFWVDECQYLIDPSDGDFQTTARSSLCCTVFLTQTISHLYAEFGNESKVNALMSCLQTKIFHQNGDSQTNSWASKTIQKMPVTTSSQSRPKGGFFLNQSQGTVTESIHWEDDVPGRVFLNLKSGGPENKFQVEGIVFYPGRKFSSGKPWMKAIFDQKKILDGKK